MVATDDILAGLPPSPPENTAPLAASRLAASSDGGRRRGLWASLFGFLPRRLSKAEESEQAAEQRERDRLMSHRLTLELEADNYAGIIPDKLADLGICYHYKKSEKDSGDRIKKVSIRKPHVLRDEAIYLHVDLRPGKAPGVRVDDLAERGTLDNLSIACGHKVLCKYAPEKGFWYIVERETGVRGIPAHVKYDEFLSGRAANADGLTLPIGVGENKTPTWKSLGLMQSMLIAGTTGGGKSNFLNVLICTMLRYNSKRRLRLLLVDLKGGVEFSYYAGIPHLLPIPLPPKKKDDPERMASIIEDRQDVVPAFEWLVKEGERRLAALKADHFKHIGEYNYHHHNEPMPHIACFVDEWADVKLEPKLGREAEELLINIASRFRAVGIHLIICTQTPNKDVVSIRVKNVLPARLAFACPNVHSSMLIIGNGRAAGLEPQGRAIFDLGKSMIEVQTPLINNKTVDETVAAAIRGQFDDVRVAAHDVTDLEIYTWALESNKGNLDYRSVWGAFRLRGLTQDYAKMFCKSSEGQTVIVGATAYKITAGDRRIARRLMPIPDDDKGAPDKS